MNKEISFIGLIAFAAITVFEVPILAVPAQLAVRPCPVPDSKFHQRLNDFRPLAVSADIQSKFLKHL